LIARDPEAPIGLDLGSMRASLAASTRGLARPVVAAAAELLGLGRDGHAALRPTVPVDTAGLSGGGVNAAGGRLAPLARHRRLLPLSSCLLLVTIAAVSALPPVSTARGGQEPSAAPVTAASDGSDVSASASDDATQPDASGGPVAGDQTQVDAGGDNSGGAAPVDAADPGDGSIYNVMQPADIAAGSSDFQIYVVAGGDSLPTIATKFGLSRNTIYWANTSRLPDPASIHAGLKLVIPPDDGVTVTVKAGTTMSAYASKYKVSVQAIMVANGLSDVTLTAGQLLLVPVIPVPAIPGAKGGCVGSCGGTTWSGGKLRWPVPASNTITQYFSSSHAAIDIGAPTGSAVIAAAGGTVVFAGWNRGGAGFGGGIEVWIFSGGKIYTTYNHLSAEFVRVGQVVAAGQRIGNVGMTGNATGPHLHFEVWVCYPWTGGNTGCARNPLRYF
jgi:LysM repeat protein